MTGVFERRAEGVAPYEIRPCMTGVLVPDAPDAPDTSDTFDALNVNEAILRFEKPKNE